MTDLHWLARHLDRHFEYTDQGRLRANAATRPPAFLIGRTRHGNLWRLREDLPQQAVVDLARHAGKEAPIRGDVLASPPPERLEPIRRALAAGGFPGTIHRHRLYRCEAGEEVRVLPWKERDWPQETDVSGLDLFGDLFVLEPA